MAKGANSSQLLSDLRAACACSSRNGRTSPLAKPELGIKRTCPECAARFYDLCKMPCECPKCEHSFEPEILLKSKKRVVEADKPKPAPEAAPVAEAEDEEEEESGVEEVSAEGMSKMPAEVDEDGLAVAPGGGDEEETLSEVDADIESSDDDDENDTLVNFDDDDDAEDVAAIIDADIDKLKDDL